MKEGFRNPASGVYLWGERVTGPSGAGRRIHNVLEPRFRIVSVVPTDPRVAALDISPFRDSFRMADDLPATRSYISKFLAESGYTLSLGPNGARFESLFDL
jgi:hypothetical protein